MTRKTMEADIKVGLFVSIGLGLTMLAILLLSGPTAFFTKNLTYTAHFNRVEGLIPGAKVILHGVSVGTVESIDLEPSDRMVKVEFSVSKAAADWLRQGSTIEIATQGVLGDKYLSLESGPENGPLIPPGSDVPHKQSSDLSRFIGQGDRLMSSLNQVAARVDQLLRTFETDNRNEVFFKGLATTAHQLSQAAEKLNQSLDSTQLKDTIAQLHAITQKINNGTGTVGALINDPSLYENLNALLGGANRNRVIRNLVRQSVKESK